MSQMVKQQQRQQQIVQQTSARRADVEDLASRIFAQKIATVTGRIPHALAQEAIDAAKAFFRTCDESLSDL